MVWSQTASAKVMGDNREKPSSSENLRTISSADSQSNSMMPNDKQNNEQAGQIDGTCRSLNSIFGYRIGLLQSLSLLLNAGLMVYAHVGVSGVFLSNQQRIGNVAASSSASNTNKNSTDNVTSNENNSSTEGNLTSYTGACAAEDFEVWEDGGFLSKSDDSIFCATGSSGCMFDEACTTSCFVENFGYTRACASCFAKVPSCSFQAGCAAVCGSTPNSAECADCSFVCYEDFYSCTGLPDLDTTRTPTKSPTAAPTLDAITAQVNSRVQKTPDVCERQQEGVDPESVDTFYVVYEIKFFEAIRTAWNNDAKLLAVIVVVFSGIWPYTKNILLMVAWYLPMTEKRRSSMLLWLRRLGKYTLVDVYVVIVLIIGVMLEITVAGGVPVIVRGEPRLALLAFLFATLWEFAHTEWMTYYHHETLSHNPAEQKQVHEEDVLDSLRFRSSCWSNQSSLACRSPGCLRAGMWLLLSSAVGLFLAGATFETIRFKTILTGETEGCVRSYSLYTLGMSLVSDLNMQWNSAKGATWTLFFAYMLLLVVLPLFVHTLQVLVSTLRLNDKRLCQTADMCWTFASVDVFLLGLFVVQYKFEELIETIAGTEGSEFFGMTSELGPGFFVLIGYSVLAGFFQYLFNFAVSQHYQIDSNYSAVDYVWTKVFGCFLNNSRNMKAASEQALASTRSPRL